MKVPQLVQAVALAPGCTYVQAQSLVEAVIGAERVCGQSGANR